jgi:hypothetical protein
LRGRAILIGVDPEAPPAEEATQESAAARDDYKARREEFVSERKQKRKHVMTPARLERNRMNPYRSGKRARTVTSLDYIKYQLGRVSKDLPAILDACIEAQKGNLSALEVEVAKRLAADFILRDVMFAKIKSQGISVVEIVRNDEGKPIGKRIRVHPLLEHLNRLNEQLGITMEQACLSKKSRGQGARDAAITSALLSRDARLREARRLQLAAPDPDLLREDDEDLPS